MLNKNKPFWEKVKEKLGEVTKDDNIYCEVKGEYAGRFFETTEACLVTDFNEATVGAAIVLVLNDLNEDITELERLSKDNFGKTAMVYY